MFEALIFDFDGLVIDTEMPQYRAWRTIYAEHGHDLPIDHWVACLGRGPDTYDFYGQLERWTGEPLDRQALRDRKDALAGEAIAAEPIRPGVERYLADAPGLGLKLAVASGSRRFWVEGHLRRLGLREHFGVVVTNEDTERHKPDPDPFLETARRMGVDPARCVVLEDSPNGLLAAKAAGMVGVAVPTAMTAPLDLSAAALRIGSLADLSLAQLLEQAGRRVASA